PPNLSRGVHFSGHHFPAIVARSSYKEDRRGRSVLIGERVFILAAFHLITCPLIRIKKQACAVSVLAQAGSHVARVGLILMRHEKQNREYSCEYGGDHQGFSPVERHAFAGTILRHGQAVPVGSGDRRRRSPASARTTRTKRDQTDAGCRAVFREFPRVPRPPPGDGAATV